MTETDPLIYPGLPPLEGYTCPHCGVTGRNQSIRYHYEHRAQNQFVPVIDGENCDACGGLVPLPARVSRSMVR